MAAHGRDIDFGTPAPDFALLEATGRRVSLQEARGPKGTLVAFICNHCPYVIHMLDALARYARDYAPQGIAVVGINPNDPITYPDERPDRVAEIARRLPFPYLIDADQSVAIAYGAACTPDLYLFDAGLRLFDHGQFDATRPGGSPATGSELRAASDRLFAGASPTARAASMGCSIKWAAARAAAAGR